MLSRHIMALVRSYRIVKFELICHCCSFYGFIKTKLFFNKAKLNKLEIGSGRYIKKAGFITSDIDLLTDYPYDLRLGLPFPDASIDFIYTEHVLEHLEYHDIIHLMSECYRVLKSNGILSVSVPNASIYLDAYNNHETFDHKKYCLYGFGLTYNSKIDYVNYISYMDGHHRHMFDEENLLEIMSLGGFTDIALRGYDPGLDQEARKYESIYAVCIKTV